MCQAATHVLVKNPAAIGNIAEMLDSIFYCANKVAFQPGFPLP